MQARLTEIRRSEALRYLGWKGGALPPEIEADIARCEALLMETARPRAVWRKFGLAPDGAMLGTDFRPAGEDIRRLLSGCESAVLIAATLGAEAETLLRRMQVRSMADAVILDACAGAAIENVCDNLCTDIAAELAPMFLTERFSPGYGDLPLAQQRELCRVLDVGRRIGVSLSDGGIMIPQKTVTAILGVSPIPTAKRRRGCEGCELYETCAYRKDGTTCGKS